MSRSSASASSGAAELAHDLQHTVKIHNNRISNTSTFSAGDSFRSIGMSAGNTFSVEDFLRELRVDIVESTVPSAHDEGTLIFDLVGLEAPLANALRRIMMAEVPTMAVERVEMINNTSVIPDEVLAHRLGMVPILADPRKFHFKSSSPKAGTCGGLLELEEEEDREDNAVVFELHVRCTAVPGQSEDADEDRKYINHRVLSSDFVWKPIGSQAETFRQCPIRPVHDDILIAKLRPGQEISARMVCVKGIGQDHAKFSPVSTTSYRLLTDVRVNHDLVTGHLAEKLVEMCPVGVFELEDGHAIPAHPRKCTLCRECIRHEGWEDRVQISRNKKHFIFSVESTGVLKPEEIVEQALEVLIQKCTTLLTELTPGGEASGDEADAQSSSSSMDEDS